jgi:hypothetical protein
MQGELFYLPKVAENPYPVPFKLVSSENNRLVFENPGHDFPQRIIYTLHAADSLTATTAGLVDGADRSIDFHFKRKDKAMQ